MVKMATNLGIELLEESFLCRWNGIFKPLLKQSELIREKHSVIAVDNTSSLSYKSRSSRVVSSVQNLLQMRVVCDDSQRTLLVKAKTDLSLKCNQEIIKLNNAGKYTTYDTNSFIPTHQLSR